MVDEDVRVNTSWRVFEISSGDIGDAGNYGGSILLRRVSHGQACVDAM